MFTPSGILILPANKIKSCYLISGIVILFEGSFTNIFFNKSAAYGEICLGILKSECLIFSYNYLVFGSSNGTHLQKFFKIKYPQIIAYKIIPHDHRSVFNPS